eukprot:6706589-Pyramimonas_sp.AAC.1
MDDDEEGAGSSGDRGRGSSLPQAEDGFRDDGTAPLSDAASLLSEERLNSEADAMADPLAVDQSLTDLTCLDSMSLNTAFVTCNTVRLLVSWSSYMMRTRTDT